MAKVFPRERQPGSGYGQIYHYLDIAINLAQTTTGRSFERNSCLCPQSIDQFFRTRYVDGSFRRADTLRGFVNLID